MLNRLKPKNQRGSRQRGMQLVEMAFLLPIMLVLLGAIGEFGRYFHMRSTLLRATRAAAGYMWDKPNTSTNRTAAIRLALCGQVDECTVASELTFPGLTEANFAINFSTVSGANYVTASTVNAQYVPVFKITTLMGTPDTPWGAMNVNVNTRMRYLFTTF